jgi:hypothetical protein
MNSWEYYKKVEEVLSLFSPDFKEKFRTNATAHIIVETLVRGGNIYNIIEQMIDNQEKQQQVLRRAIETNPHPFTLS